MGYTHYWKHGDIEPQEWSVFTADVRKILRTEIVPLAGGLGSGLPLVTDDEIRFNGVAADGDDYETFALSPDATGFDFCKTGVRPYDVVVTCVLLRAVLTIPGFQASSDGTWDEWKDARDLYTQVFGTEPPANSPLHM